MSEAPKQASEVSPTVGKVPPLKPIRSSLPVKEEIRDLTKRLSEITMKESPKLKRLEPLVVPKTPKNMSPSKSPEQIAKEFRYLSPIKDVKKDVPAVSPISPTTIAPFEIDINDYVTVPMSIPHPVLLNKQSGCFEGKIIECTSPSSFMFQFRPLELHLMMEEMK